MSLQSFKPSQPKLVSLKELPAHERSYYQREQRTAQKEEFRHNMDIILGENFKIMAEIFQKKGLGMFRDFCEPAIFQKFIDEYDHRMDEASKSALKYYFLEFQNKLDFLTNPEFKDVFSHPLIIALIAYQIGGPIRLVGVRGKNAEAELTMVRDNGPHVDDNPFNDEWKLLITWLLDENGKSLNHGPQGQPFISIIETQKMVRSKATEFGANFKNPLELLELFKHPMLKQQAFFVEVQDERPNWAIFEASHQIHHRKRDDTESARGCIIFAYHLVDQESIPTPYAPNSELTGCSQLEKFVMGDLSYDKSIAEINQYFLNLIQENKAQIEDKLTELANGKFIAVEEKMMTAPQLVNYFNLIIRTYKKEYLESRSEMRFQLTELTSAIDNPINAAQVAKKLLESSGEYDKHYDLDLKVYPNKIEQIRKIPRTAIRERSVEDVSFTRFNKLHIPNLQLTLLVADEFETYSETRFTQYATKLCTLMAKYIPSSILAMLQTPSTLNVKEFANTLIQLAHHERSLAEIYQLTADIGEAFSHCEDIKALRGNCYFLYLVYDQFIISHSNLCTSNEIQTLEEDAQSLLQNYFELVVTDDLTYKFEIQTLEISQTELLGKLENLLVKIGDSVSTFSTTHVAAN